MLKFNERWRFDSPGEIPHEVDEQFFQLVNKLAKDEQVVFEKFKRTFASASGNSTSYSSNSSWASSDLMGYMTEARSNAPTYIEAFYDGWSNLGSEYPAVNIDVINRILAKANSRYQIKDGELIFDGPELIPSPEIPKSLLEEARKTIDDSLLEAERLFQEGRYRPAVQETLWLLETIVTVFDKMEVEGHKIEGKYFNKIIEKLAEKTSQVTLKQVIDWVRKLHGYLSAPSGGGIRHGSHLAEGIAVTPNEARLYYNLSKTYITYFLGEYEALKDSSNDDDLLF